MNNFFNDDGMWMGAALQSDQTRQIAEAYNKQRQQKLDAFRERDKAFEQRDKALIEKRNVLAEKIKSDRLRNIIDIAEYEYDTRTYNDAEFLAQEVSEKLEAGGGELELYSDMLNRARVSKKELDRDDWVKARVEELIANCRFPENDFEAAKTGGYAIPFPDSMPPFLEKTKALVKKGELDDPERHNVLTNKKLSPYIKSILRP